MIPDDKLISPMTSRDERLPQVPSYPLHNYVKLAPKSAVSILTKTRTMVREHKRSMDCGTVRLDLTDRVYERCEACGGTLLITLQDVEEHLSNEQHRNNVEGLEKVVNRDEKPADSEQ